jgi:hypothetical protein
MNRFVVIIQLRDASCRYLRHPSDECLAMTKSKAHAFKFTSAEEAEDWVSALHQRAETLAGAFWQNAGLAFARVARVKLRLQRA